MKAVNIRVCSFPQQSSLIKILEIPVAGLLLLFYFLTILSGTALTSAAPRPSAGAGKGCGKLGEGSAAWRGKLDAGRRSLPALRGGHTANGLSCVKWHLFVFPMYNACTRWSHCCRTALKACSQRREMIRCHSLWVTCRLGALFFLLDFCVRERDVCKGLSPFNCREYSLFSP